MLPKLPYKTKRKAQEVVQLRGLNYSDNFKDGSLAECINLSSRRYPYFTTRRERQIVAGYESISSLTAWGKLFAVQRDGKLIVDGHEVGSVTPGKKQFAVVNTKLVIWPDKVYLDVDNNTLHDMGADVTASNVTFTKNSISFNASSNPFKSNDTLTISGSSKSKNNIDVTFDVVTFSGGKITLTCDEEIFEEGTDTSIRLERKIPDMDYICVSENRLWGCSNKARTIYASALGDPTNFFTYRGVSTDSYALAVGTEGDFTGCIALSSSLLFWKQNKLHKILGSYPAEYEMYTYTMEGVAPKCFKSMIVVNEVLMYMSLHGVYSYSGGSTTLISTELGEHTYSEAIAGTDGENYYISAYDGSQWDLYTFDTIHGIWLKQDNTHAVDFARIGKELYMLDTEGSVYLMDSGEESTDITWSAQFTPFYETASGRKIYSKILLRVEIPEQSWMKAEYRTDGGIWQESGKLFGNKVDTQSMVIGFNRCDKFEIRLSGEGQCTIKNMIRIFTLGSDK